MNLGHEPEVREIYRTETVKISVHLYDAVFGRWARASVSQNVVDEAVDQWKRRYMRAKKRKDIILNIC